MCPLYVAYSKDIACTAYPNRREFRHLSQDEFIKLLNEHNYSYIVGKAWTIDAPYRETRKKVADRKSQGCVCVDMECSAISALAKFRNKEVFQFFYAADNLDSAKWDQRSLGNSEKNHVLFFIQIQQKIHSQFDTP